MNILLFGLGITLIIPSVGVVYKYSGDIGVAIYVVLNFLWIVFFPKLTTIFLAKVTKQQSLWLAAATFALLIGVFVIGYPIAHSGKYRAGSDSDQALNLATSELLHARYPYYPKTFLDNPISPMPGSLFMAIPFVILGDAAYQNILWLFIFFAILCKVFEDRRLALLIVWVLFLSPGFLQAFVTGSDYIANSLFILTFIYGLITSVSQTNGSIWKQVAFAVLLGIGLSSRANFLLLLPLLFSFILQQSNWRVAAKYTLITLLFFALVTLPFYLYDPSGFSPLHTANKLGQFEFILPYSGIIIPLITGFLSLGLSLPRFNSRSDLFFRNCAIIIAFPILCGVVLSSIGAQTLDLNFTFLGQLFSFFGLMGFCIRSARLKADPGNEAVYETKALL